MNTKGLCDKHFYYEYPSDECEICKLQSLITEQAEKIERLESALLDAEECLKQASEMDTLAWCETVRHKARAYFERHKLEGEDG